MLETAVDEITVRTTIEMRRYPVRRTLPSGGSQEAVVASYLSGESGKRGSRLKGLLPKMRLTRRFEEPLVRDQSLGYDQCTVTVTDRMVRLYWLVASSL